MTNSPIIAQGLSKTIGNTAVIRGLDLRLTEGKATLLVGDEDAKTVLLKLFAGLLSPTRGELSVFGVSPTTPHARTRTAYLAPSAALPPHMTLPALVRFYTEFFPDFDPELANTRIAALRIKNDKRMRDFSRSTREKIYLIMTLSRRASLFLLDEPFRGDDTARAYAKNLILDTISADATVVIATKYVAEIEESIDEFMNLNGGSIQNQGDTDTNSEGGHIC